MKTLLTNRLFVLGIAGILSLPTFVHAADHKA